MVSDNEDLDLRIKFLRDSIKEDRKNSDSIPYRRSKINLLIQIVKKEAELKKLLKKKQDVLREARKAKKHDQPP